MIRRYGTQAQDYFYSNGQVLGDAGSAGVHFDSVYQPIAEQFSAAGVASYQVRQGDTLPTVARTVYGDDRLWYLIADANGLSGSEALTAGSTLTIPRAITDLRNSADVFAPYEARDAIGDTTPQFPPPPPPKKKCGGLATVLVIAVAAIVTVATGGTTAAPIASALSTSVGATTATGLAATGLTAAVGAAAGSVAGQLTGIALGVQESFSFGDVARSALTAGLTAGISAGIADKLGIAGDVARGAMQSAVGQGVNIALGFQDNFSWTNVAASAVSSGLTGGRTGNGPLDRMTGAASLEPGFAKNFLAGATAGLVNRTVTIALHGGGKLELANIAADAFGNALGNSIVSHMQYAGLPAEVKEMTPQQRDAYLANKQAFQKTLSESDAEALALRFARDSVNPGSAEERFGLLSEGLSARGDRDPSATLAAVNGAQILNAVDEGAFGITSSPVQEAALGTPMPIDSGIVPSVPESRGITDLGSILLRAEPVLDLAADASVKVSGFLAQHEMVGNALWALNFAVAPVQTLVSEGLMRYTSVGGLIEHASAAALDAGTKFVQGQSQIDDPNRAAKILFGGVTVTSLAIGGVAAFKSFASKGVPAISDLMNSPEYRSYRAGMDSDFTRNVERPLGRGSTADLTKGTTLPRNLREQYALEEAMDNPLSGTPTPTPMTDTRWNAKDGWVKMQQLVQTKGSEPVNVHYNYNPETYQVDDFKIVIPGPRPQKKP